MSSKGRKNPSPEPTVVGTNEPPRKKADRPQGQVIIDTSKGRKGR